MLPVPLSSFLPTNRTSRPLGRDGAGELGVERVLRDDDAEVALWSGPSLGDDVPDAEVVERERELDAGRGSGLEVDAGEAAEDARGLAGRGGELEVELRDLSDGAAVVSGLVCERRRERWREWRIPRSRRRHRRS